MAQAFEDVLGELPSILGSDVPSSLPGAITWAAESLGIDPVDLATVMSYETGGTFDPWQKGPTTKWGEHRGLLQWGEPQRGEFNVTKDQPLSERAQAWVAYLKRAGVTPGTSLIDIYSAVNAGRVGRHGASDRPGHTVASHVANMQQHRQKAESLLSGETGPTLNAPASSADTTSTVSPSSPLAVAAGGLPSRSLSSLSSFMRPQTQSASPIPQLVPIRVSGWL